MINLLLSLVFSSFFLQGVTEATEVVEGGSPDSSWVDEILSVPTGFCTTEDGAFLNRRALEELLITLERNSGNIQSLECQLKLEIRESELNYQIRNFQLDAETLEAENDMLVTRNIELERTIELQAEEQLNTEAKGRRMFYLGITTGIVLTSAVTFATYYSVTR